jgi:copper homeostasis protein CutC
MDRQRIIMLVVVVVLVVVVAIAFPVLANAYTRSSALSRCAELEAQLATIRTQGGDANTANQLQIQLEQCYGRAKDAGATLDLGAVLVRDCATAARQMQLEFTHYRSTTYDDPVKRNNTRSTILRLCEDAAACFNRAVERAESVGALREIKQIVVSAIADTVARRQCYQNDEPGCGRFALNEDHGNDKAAQETARCVQPLENVVSAINAKIERIEAATAAAARTTTTSAALTAGPGVFLA